MMVILKRQQFENSRSNEMESRGSNRQRLNECDNEERNGLNKDKGEIKYVRYVLPPFILLLLPQKVSNRSSNLHEGIKSLNHLVYISKICYSRNANFALEFPSKGDLKAQKKFYTSRVREGLKFYLASTASIAFGTTNHYYLNRKRLKSYRLSNHRPNLKAQICANKR